MTVPIELDKLDGEFKADVLNKIPAANYDLCLTCGTCTGGCPASELLDMDPGKLVRMLVLGLDEEVQKTDWAWVCTMCARCFKQCPMSINIPGLVYNMRANWPREESPKGIRNSCDQHIRSGNAMGAPAEDFKWTVEDVAEEIRETQPGFEDLQVSVDRKGAHMVINQNSREPVTEPDELSPLWKILHMVGADWTYPMVMWGGENYCLLLADEDGWRHILQEFVNHINKLGSPLLVNTE